MSESSKYVITAAGFIVISVVYVLFSWRSAERDAHKQISRLTPPTDLSLGVAGTRWLVDRLAQRTRLCAIVTGLLNCAFAVALLTLHDEPIIRETVPISFLFASAAGYIVGSTIATASAARAGSSTQRSATLTIRTSRTYLRTWEHLLQSVNLTASVLGAVIAGWLWFDSDLDGVYVGLMATWSILVALLVLLQHWVLRSPPIVDERLHVARELMISISVRMLAIYHVVSAGLIGFIAGTYLWLHSDLPWLISVTPLYAAGGVGLVTHIVGSQRRERGLPAPEWHFARTLEPNP